MKQIAHIESLFPTKFGIPRQAGIVDTQAQIVFEPEYQVPEAVRGLEDFEYIWIVWQFSQAIREDWQPTVRPPRLGGNKRMGVFATRSPYRPNPIGLSSVKLTGIIFDHKRGPILEVSGADLMDGTPIYDIKPYLPYTDSHPNARSGFAPTESNHYLTVCCTDDIQKQIPPAIKDSLWQILSHDPRPQYQNDPTRIYHLPFGEFEIDFKVEDSRCVIIGIKKNAF